MSLADKIVLQQGDLTEMDVDAVVNAANNDLQLGGGLAGVIRRRAGESIQRECNQIGSIPVGGAAMTSGGTLRIAAEKGLRTIAFPAVGTGIGGFPLSECADIMLREAVEHLKRPTSLEAVHFVLFDARALAAFQKELRAMEERGELADSRATGSG
jgi:O-acetyl-ADP-ribose deacetylase (regulator of RNase III)